MLEKFNTIRLKSLALMVVVLSLIFAILGFIIISYTRIALEKEYSAKMLALVENVSKDINDFFVRGSVVSKQIAYNDQIIRYIQINGTDKKYKNYKDYKSILKTLKTLNDSNDLTTSHFTSIYIGMAKSGSFVGSDEWVPPADYVITKRPWYEAAIRNKSTSSTLYLDTEGYFVVTVSTPIYDTKKNIIGVAAVDVKFDNVVESLKKFKIGKTGFAFLVDDNMKTIYQPYSKSQIDELFLQNTKIKEAFINKQKGTGLYKFKNKNYILAYTPIKANNWMVGVSMLQDESQAYLTKIKKILVLFFFVSMLSSILLLFFFTRRDIIKPIETLTKISDELSMGNFDVQVVNENKQTEEIKKLTTSLIKFIEVAKENQKNEKLLNLIVNNIPDGIIIVNNLIINSCNPAITDMFKYSESELIGLPFDKLIPSCLDIALNPDKSFVEVQKEELLGVKKDGTYFPLEVSIIELLIDGNHNSLIHIRDITKQKELDKAKDEFISTISHELRTPLTSIQGSLGLILSSALGDVNTKISKMLELAYSNSIRLTALINDILDVEQIRAGKMHFDIKPVDLMSIIAEVVETSNIAATELGITVNIISDDENIKVYADKDRLTQVITNLLSNAIKFSPQNEVIDISITKTNQCVKVCITDRGPGISEEFKKRIFQRFAQEDSSDSRKKGGTGLGLNICKILIEKMDGKIGFYQNDNKGITFYIEIPFSI